MVASRATVSDEMASVIITSHSFWPGFQLLSFLFCFSKSADKAELRLDVSGLEVARLLASVSAWACDCTG